MANGVDQVSLQPGERVILRPEAGGDAGYSGWLWLLGIFGAMHVFGSVITLAIAPLSAASSIQAFGTLAIALGAFLLWRRHRQKPGCVLTDRRLILTRFLRAPLELPVNEIGSATRFTIVYTRYGRTVGQKVTSRVVVGLRSGRAYRFGPLKEAEHIERLLQAIGKGWIDVRALPGADGSPARAFERSDLFLVLECAIGGARRGPVFAGPTKVVGFYHQVPTLRGYQLLSIVGADKPASEIEEGIVALAANREWGQSVVMDRQDRTLAVIGNELTLASADQRVGFVLDAADAERARAFTAARSPYR